MAASLEFDHLEKGCLLCHREFIEVPKLLPCFHSICKECLQQKMDRLDVGDKLLCPHCGMESTVISGGMNRIQDDFLHEVNLKLSEIYNVNKPFCNVCESIDEKILALHYCIDCQFYLCHRDRQTHKATPSQRNHIVLSLEQLKSRKYDREISCIQSGNCPNHVTETKGALPWSFYCKECDVLVCQECLMATHPGHTVTSIREGSEGYLKGVKDLHELIKQFEQTKMDAIKQTETEIDAIRKESNNEVVKVRERGNEIKAEIGRLVDESVAGIKTKTSIDEMNLIALLEAFTNQENCSDKVISFVEDFFKMTSDVFTTKHRQTITANVNTCLRYMEPLQDVRMNAYTFTNVSDTESTIQMKQLFGEIKDVKGEFDEFGQAMISIINPSASIYTAERPTVNQRKNFALKYKWASCHSPDIAVADNGNIFTFSDNVIAIRGTQGNMLKFIPIVKSSFNWNIAINGTKVYVTNLASPAIIFMLDLEDNNIKRGELYHDGIVGLAIDQHNEKVYVSHNNGIYKGSIDNMKFSLFSKQSLFNPNYMCVTKEHNVIVSNYGSHSINCYDKNGLILWEYGLLGELNGPTGVCSDNVGHIFISDSRNNRIHMITKEGQFLQYVDAGEDIISPCGLAFKDGCLFITTLQPDFIYCLRRL